MTTIPLHRPLSSIWVDGLRHLLARVHAAWLAYVARRRAESAERELLALNLRTLEDIGAPHGLIGQRRWQDEAVSADIDRALNRRGW